ncbi:MAG: NrfD/PsrC family molybdoenzyme membrane anchor subunit [Gordonibacter sp.]|nr:NrfD/PsrC family molybdoenzyme membrane anchor subunit [Gordonibacter sp.]
MTIQSMWGLEPAIYLFLGGLAGGTFFVSAIVRLVTKDRFPCLALISPWVSTIALAVGLLCLVVEVEKPLQALMMWKSFVNFGSWMTIGAWLLFAAIAVFGVCAIFSTPRLATAIESLFKPLKSARKGIVRVTLILGAVLGLLVAAYTGVLLMAAGAIPLWNTPLIPTLFTVSALDAGTSVTIVCLLIEKGGQTARSKKVLTDAVLILVAAEAVVLLVLLMTLSGGSPSQSVSALTLTEGSLSLPFWGLVVGIGLAVPFVLGAVELTNLLKNKELARILHFIAVACALIGGFALRYVILAGGIHGAMVSPDTQQAIMGVYNLIL